MNQERAVLEEKEIYKKTSHEENLNGLKHNTQFFFT